MLDHAPDALLLDIEMPNLNGYDVLSMMRVHPELAQVKTIILTSRTSEKHQARALELGALAYLTKPCPQDVLLETIQSLLK
jgi:chemosensory pili system protein ChpA (sensor histidine kinase/response regulator)